MLLFLEICDGGDGKKISDGFYSWRIVGLLLESTLLELQYDFLNRLILFFTWRDPWPESDTCFYFTISVSQYFKEPLYMRVTIHGLLFILLVGLQMYLLIACWTQMSKMQNLYSSSYIELLIICSRPSSFLKDLDQYRHATSKYLAGYPFIIL